MLFEIITSVAPPTRIASGFPEVEATLFMIFPITEIFVNTPDSIEIPRLTVERILFEIVMLEPPSCA